MSNDIEKLKEGFLKYGLKIKNLKAKEEKINKGLRKKLINKRIDKLDYLQSDLFRRIIYEEAVEGDICNAREGEEVRVTGNSFLVEDKYKGNIGIVDHKWDHSLSYKNKQPKDFVVYAVRFSDGNLVKFHHKDLKFRV